MKKITPRSEDYSKWYLDVIEAADMAENSDVRGCMVIKPNAYGIWEEIQKVFNQKFRKIGIKNAYFPLLIPVSYLAREAEHVEGFAKECAVVTHHRLKADEEKGLIPDGELEEKFVIRPTSETIIYNAFSKWVKSYRDLPVKINQWANVMRWEMRTRFFLRSSEFLWQEGHTAFATAEESDANAREMLEVYRDFSENVLAIPCITGMKPFWDKFPGAVNTYAFEGIMQDGKALQMGTSHDLGDNFAKPFEVKYLDQNNELQYVHQTSWGVTTRLIGAIIMTHGDDNGMVLPPKIAPVQVAIIPIAKDSEDAVAMKAKEIFEELGDMRCELDERYHLRPGEKFFSWEKVGTPIRIELGGRDLEAGVATVARRDTGEKVQITFGELKEKISEILEDIQKNLFEKAEKRMQEQIIEVSGMEGIKKVVLEEDKVAKAYICEKCGKKLEETAATVRCAPLSEPVDENAKCSCCGEKALDGKKYIIAKAY